MSNAMNATEYALLTATAEHDALADIGWKVGPVEVQANGRIGFTATSPFRVVGAGKKARAYPERTGVYTYVGGILTVEWAS